MSEEFNYVYPKTTGPEHPCQWCHRPETASQEKTPYPCGHWEGRPAFWKMCPTCLTNHKAVDARNERCAALRRIFVASAGQSPLLVDPRGHAWREVHQEWHKAVGASLPGHPGVSAVSSWQECVCGAVRPVMYHEPPEYDPSRGFMGLHPWIDRVDDRSIAPCMRGEKTP